MNEFEKVPFFCLYFLFFIIFLIPRNRRIKSFFCFHINLMRALSCTFNKPLRSYQIYTAGIPRNPAHERKPAEPGSHVNCPGMLITHYAMGTKAPAGLTVTWWFLPLADYCASDGIVILPSVDGRTKPADFFFSALPSTIFTHLSFLMIWTWFASLPSRWRCVKSDLRFQRSRLGRKSGKLFLIQWYLEYRSNLELIRQQLIGSKQQLPACYSKSIEH